MSVDLGSAYGKIIIDTSQAKKAAGEVTSALGKTTQATGGLKAGLSTVGVALGATALSFAAITRAAQQAYGAIKEGAQLELARSRFDNLSASINTTGDMLLGKLRDATHGMVSDAGLVESATSMISLGFAKTSDEAVRLTSVAGQLGWNMQQLTLTLANQSTMRLDALGLSVEEVTTRFKELKASGMDAQEAFKMSVIEAGEKKLRLLGSAADTAAGKMAMFEAATDNITDSLKLAAVEISTNIGLIDKLVSVSTGLARGTGFVDELTRAWRDGTIALAEYERLMNTMRGDTTDRNGNLIEAGAMTQLDLLTELKKALDEGTISQEGYNRMVKETATNYQAVKSEIDRYNAQLKYSNRYTQDATEATETAVQTGTRWRDILSLTSSQLEAGAAWRQAYEYDLRRIAAEEDHAAVSAENAARKVEELTAAFNALSGDYVSQLPGADDALVTPAMDVSYTTGGRTGEQNKLLEEYADLAERAADEIYNLTNGIGTFGMEQDKVNKKLAEAQEEFAYYQEMMAPLEGITGEVSTKHHELAVNVDAAKQALYDAAVAAGAQPEQLAALGVAIGILTDAEAEALLKAAALYAKIQELGALIAAGYPIEKAMADLGALIAVMNGEVVPATQAVQENALAIRTAMIEAAEGSLDAANDLGVNVTEGLAQGISDSLETAETEGTALGDAVIDATRAAVGAQSPATEFIAIGQDIISGLIAGVQAMAQSFIDALVAIVKGAVQAARDAVGAQSPATEFIDIGHDIGDGLIEGIQDSEDGVLKAMRSLMGKVSGIARGAANWYEDTVLAPLAVPLDALNVAVEANAESLGDTLAQMEEFLGSGTYGALMNMTPAERAAALHGLQQEAAFQPWSPNYNPTMTTQLQAALNMAYEQVRLEEERAAAAAEYAAQQERILKLQEQQSQLDFLQTQLDLVQLITDSGLDTSILSGLELGLGADAGGVLDAMTAAIAALIEAAEDELDIHSPSGVFEDIGANIMAGMVRGISKQGALADAFFEQVAMSVKPDWGTVNQATNNIYGGLYITTPGTVSGALNELYRMGQ